MFESCLGIARTSLSVATVLLINNIKIIMIDCCCGKVSRSFTSLQLRTKSDVCTCISCHVIKFGCWQTLSLVARHFVCLFLKSQFDCWQTLVTRRAHSVSSRPPLVACWLGMRCFPLVYLALLWCSWLSFGWCSWLCWGAVLSYAVMYWLGSACHGCCA